MTEKLLPEEVWVWLGPDDEMNVDTHGEGHFVPAVKYTPATPAPVSGEVDEAIQYAQGRVNKIGAIKAQSFPQIEEELRAEKRMLETLITAAKTAPCLSKTPTSEKQDDLSIYSELRVPGFTREGLVKACKPAVMDWLKDQSHLKGAADVVIDALIDMGAVKLVQPLQDKNGISEEREG